MAITKRIHTIVPHHLKSSKPRKSGVFTQDTEYYSKEDMDAISEGFEEIKRGECVTHEELRRLAKL